MEIGLMKSILPVWKTTPGLFIKHFQAPTVNTELTTKMPNIGSEVILVLISALKINACSDWILFNGGNISSNHTTITLKSKINFPSRDTGTNKQTVAVHKGNVLLLYCYF